MLDIQTLSPEQVDEIVNRRAYAYPNGMVVRLTTSERDALCQTVRALQAQYESAVVDFASEINRVNQSLAEITKERDDLRTEVEGLRYQRMFTDSHVGDD